MFPHYSYGGGGANDHKIQFANDKLPIGGVGAELGMFVHTADCVASVIVFPAEVPVTVPEYKAVE